MNDIRKAAIEYSEGVLRGSILQTQNAEIDFEAGVAWVKSLFDKHGIKIAQSILWPINDVPQCPMQDLQQNY